jgi:hypothetical protein
VDRLLAAIIYRAVLDRRIAVTSRWLDADCRPTGGIGRGSVEITSSLRHFFFEGGLEDVAELAGWDGLPLEKIKKKSNEPYAR